MNSNYSKYHSRSTAVAGVFFIVCLSVCSFLFLLYFRTLKNLFKIHKKIYFKLFGFGGGFTVKRFTKHTYNKELHKGIKSIQKLTSRES